MKFFSTMICMLDMPAEEAPSVAGAASGTADRFTASGVDATCFGAMVRLAASDDG